MNELENKILELAIKEASEETKEFMKEFYLDSLDFPYHHLIQKEKANDEY